MSTTIKSGDTVDRVDVPERCPCCNEPLDFVDGDWIDGPPGTSAKYEPPRFDCPECDFHVFIEKRVAEFENGN